MQNAAGVRLHEGAAPGFAGPSTLTTIVRRALDRADLHPAMRGAHVLRHSLATTMLRSGASMSEIGEILRHRTPNTTEIYAKLDFDGLRSLAHPWPSVGGATMNSLDQALNEYIAIRRALGFELREVAGCLRNFVTFLKTEGASYITKELALRWATQPADAQPYTWAWRLGMVRRFAAWHSATEPRTEIPAPGLLPHRYQRKTPHIYSDEEIANLLRRAAQLPSPKGLRAPTYTTLFGLLAVTGMRVNEALHLDRPDVDLDQGILTIRRTKFGKSRHVPVHPSTVDALKKYAEDERPHPCRTPTAGLFRLRAWHPDHRMDSALHLRQAIPTTRPPSMAKGHGRGPRLHDMRHRFAARTLIHWYRAGTRCRTRTPKAGHLSRACAYQRNLLVSGSGAGTASVGHRPSRWVTGRRRDR